MEMRDCSSKVERLAEDQEVQVRVLPITVGKAERRNTKGSDTLLRTGVAGGGDANSARRGR